MVRHFVKTLLIFTGMIFIGLLGVYLINYFDKSADLGSPASNIAK